MNSALQFKFNICSCLLVAVGYLLGTGHCQGDDELVAKGREIVSVFGNPSTDTSSRDRNLPAFVNFYEKYSDRLDLTLEQRNFCDDFVKGIRIKHPKKVDGVSAQGGYGWPFRCPFCPPPFFPDVVTAIDNAIPKHS